MPDKLQTIGDIGERRLIERIAEILGYWGNAIISGSDDAIALPAPPTPGLLPLINTDMLVSTTDIPPQMDLVQAGRKAVVMACSDLLVNGATPSWITVSLGLPKTMPVEGSRGFEGLIRGLKTGAEYLNVRYLGGDLNETSEIIVDVTAIGYIHPGHIIHRRKAREGDHIFTTGSYGLTGAGLHMLLVKNMSLEVARDSFPKCVEAVLTPGLNIVVGPSLSGLNLATASADSSDGLLRTLNEISSASNVGYKLRWTRIPVDLEVKAYCSDYNVALESVVLSGGEEFGHIFTIPAGDVSKIPAAIRDRLTDIGEIKPERDGRTIGFPESGVRDASDFRDGFLHFSPPH